MTTSTGRQMRCNRLPFMPISESAKNHSSRFGLTLIEVLIALTMTLIVLGAMAQAFKFASGEIAEGRAILEIANRLRNAEQLMRRDLAGITVDVRPHTEHTPDGYFEYIEGQETDKSTLLVAPEDGYLGDVDDFVGFTTRSLDGEFRGRFEIPPAITAPNPNPTPQTVLSSFAEVVWYSDAPDDNGDGLDNDGNMVVDFDESIVLYRRVLLIRPDLNSVQGMLNGQPLLGLARPSNDPMSVTDFFKKNDISARVEVLSDGRFFIVGNSLQDLSNRANRYARTASFPNTVDRNKLRNQRITDAFSGEPSGDEIVLTDVASFDIKIYSPNSPVLIDGNIAVNPHDIGFNPTSISLGTNTPQPYGGFIDLAFGGTAAAGTAFSYQEPQFTTAPIAKPGLEANGISWDFPTYCTWTPLYEVNGFDNDRDGVTDEGKNGLDDDGVNGVDDDGEAETAPPYPYPVRGLKTTFRVIEKNTKQIRQTSVIHNFSKM